MTLEEFYDEPRSEPKERAKESVKLAHEDDFGIDEVLPPNVWKAWIGGEVVYMTATEDGRIVRLDDWTCPID